MDGVIMKAIFWVGKTGFIGSAIRFITGAGSSHVEILFSNGYAGTSHEARGGICYYPINIKPEDWLAITIPCTPEEEYDVRKFFEVDEKGCGYDFKGIIFAQLFPWGIQSKDKWFCSEACTAALQRIKRLKCLENLKPHQIDPGELLDILGKCPDLLT